MKRKAVDAEPVPRNTRRKLDATSDSATCQARNLLDLVQRGADSIGAAFVLKRDIQLLVAAAPSEFSVFSEAFLGCDGVPDLLLTHASENGLGACACLELLARLARWTSTEDSGPWPVLPTDFEVPSVVPEHLTAAWQSFADAARLQPHSSSRQPLDGKAAAAADASAPRSVSAPVKSASPALRSATGQSQPSGLRAQSPSARREHDGKRSPLRQPRAGRASSSRSRSPRRTASRDGHGVETTEIVTIPVRALIHSCVTHMIGCPQLCRNSL
jgi:hypothetical protein